MIQDTQKLIHVECLRTRWETNAVNNMRVMPMPASNWTVTKNRTSGGLGPLPEVTSPTQDLELRLIDKDYYNNDSRMTRVVDCGFIFQRLCCEGSMASHRNLVKTEQDSLGSSAREFATRARRGMSTRAVWVQSPSIALAPLRLPCYTVVLYGTCYLGSKGDSECFSLYWT